MIRSAGSMDLVKRGAVLFALAMMVCVVQAALAIQAASAAGSGATGPGTQTSHTAVHIAVPPVTVILVNGSGSPIAVETNTSRSPRRGDMFLTTDSPRGLDLSKATQALTNQILRMVSPMAVWQPGWHYFGRG
jgi:hypothetical protein